MLRTDRKRTAQARIVGIERPLAEKRHSIEIEAAPIAEEREIDHGLAQELVAVDVFNRIGLVDDVHQMARFGDAPEHAMGADQHLPVHAAVAVMRFAHVEMRAPIIVEIETTERHEVQRLAVFVPTVGKIELAEDRRIQMAIVLAGPLRILRERPQLDADHGIALEFSGNGGRSAESPCDGAQRQQTRAMKLSHHQPPRCSTAERLFYNGLSGICNSASGMAGKFFAWMAGRTHFPASGLDGT